MAADSEEERQKANFHQNQPYDESIDVQDAEEVASLSTPAPQYPIGERGRSRGNTPPEARMTDNSDDDDFDTGQQDVMKPAPIPRVPDQQQQQMYANDEEEDDDEGTDSSDEDDDDDENGPAVEGSELLDGAAKDPRAYDPADYDHLPVTSEIKELFQYITRYTPQSIDLDHKLRPFIPDFIPAVGDIDAFIKIPRPDAEPSTLGLTVLDEPCAKQSDPTVLDLQLRTISKQAHPKSVVVKSVDNAEKNSKAIESWIESISDIHRSKPPPNVHYTKNMPDIDTLMQEWPPEFEELLKEVGLPTADIDCDLAEYVEMVCAVSDIPIYKSKIQSLHVLFTLYSEFKNSQHFRSLAEENKLDNALKGQDLAPEESDHLVI